MAIDPTINEITSDYASKAALNTNFDNIGASLQDALSRSGTSPNFMNAALDMNSNPILNLPFPDSVLSPVRRGDIVGLTDTETNLTITGAQIPEGGNVGDILTRSATGDYQLTWNRPYPITELPDIATLRAMTWQAMKQLNIVYILGFYTGSGVGGGTFVWQDNAITPNTYTIISGSDDPTGSHGAFVKNNPQWTDQEFGALEGADNTAAWQNLVNAGQGKGPLKLLTHHSIISSTITCGNATDIVGLGNGLTLPTSTYVYSTMNAPVFQHLMPLTGDGSEEPGYIRISGIFFDSPKWINIGRRGDGTLSSTDPWTQQAFLMNVELSHITGYPVNSHPYSPSVDTNANTNVAIPDVFAFGDTYGLGFELHKCYKAKITDCRTSSAGIGVILKGCDTSVVQNYFFNNTARPIHVLEAYTGSNDWGARVLLDHIQVSGCYRTGWLTIQSPNTTLRNCYIESYVYNTALALQSRNTLVDGCSFDGNGSVPSPAPFISIDGSFYGNTFVNNSIQLGAYQSETIQTTNIIGERVLFANNSQLFEQHVPEIPGNTLNSADPLIWNPRNSKILGGPTSTSNPFVLDTTSGKYVTRLTTGGSSLIVNFDTTPTLTSAKVFISGIFPNANTGFMKISWGGTQVYAGYCGPTAASTALQTTTPISITKPAGVGFGLNSLVFEFVTDQAQYYEVRIIPNV